MLTSPVVAWACPVCFSAKNEASRVAFLETTVFMTALPLLMIGGAVLWLLKRVEAVKREEGLEAAELEEPAPQVGEAGPLSDPVIVHSRS